ncbi:glutathione S-transferase [Rhizobiales bacterium GAS188]|nr:glutathione S-transferase [Rhizobiales bacterium GAS188]
MSQAMRIYGDLRSGNCLKVKYTADFLKLPYSWVPVDIMKGESRTPQFLQLNPLGQVPTIELADGRALAQSNAIIRYLAAGTELLPQDLFLQAKVDELLAWEQYNHEPYVAVCRFHMVYLGWAKEAREPQRVERGEAALDLMEKLLTGRSFFVDDRLSIADISLLAYTRLAHEGGFDLAARPAVRAWIARSEAALGIESAKVAA